MITKMLEHIKNKFNSDYVKPQEFLKKDKPQKVMKDLDNGYTIREIMEMRKWLMNI